MIYGRQVKYKDSLITLAIADISDENSRRNAYLHSTFWSAQEGLLTPGSKVHHNQ